jgi:ubiquinone/menaquinone biosynthesis C-methylase UbiE
MPGERNLAAGTAIAPALGASREGRILDAGSGTGEASWRLAELFPQAHVLGIDVVDEHLDLGDPATLALRAA